MRDRITIGHVMVWYVVLYSLSSLLHFRFHFRFSRFNPPKRKTGIGIGIENEKVENVKNVKNEWFTGVNPSLTQSVTDSTL